MFLPIDIGSMNSSNMLLSGKYEAKCQVYKSKISESFAHLYEYTLCETSEIVAYDLLVQNSDQIQTFVDYAKFPDGLWMDPYGLKSDSIEKLMPFDILDYSLINEYFAGYIHVEGETNGE